MMQGYNDRLDESLGMREGREDMMMQSLIMKHIQLIACTQKS